ncbi:hypothetical protein TUM20983_39280 [Mycobacterium antarcticum]|uniref:hypothetical protein n=1 Tax=Mycolicibacterium sp. TUM20983 TaxID=3023369 RepID=UPI0023969BA2|nr:hypothetical protein [Mycolicibacterium sp. TUM20983]GLP76818.1 hypothetical protein TUM20983_39280 [Mycolicibacterium sp. TUM20983]
MGVIFAGLNLYRPGHSVSMSKRDSKTEDEAGAEATDPPPGPADHGRQGGMATREVAPDVVENKSHG